MGLFGNLFGGGRQAPQPTSWGGSGNAPYMVGQPADYATKSAAPGFGGVQPSQGGGGSHFLDILNSFLTNFSASQGDPAALHRIQMQSEMQRQKREDANYYRHQDDQFSMFQREHEYTAAHPAPEAPTELERYMVSAGIDPHSPQGQAMFRDAATNRANPMQAVQTTTPEGLPAITFIRPSQSGAAAPPILTDEQIRAHRNQGGPSASAPRAGFPR